MGIDQLAVHSRTENDGCWTLERKYLPTVMGMLDRTSCLFLVMSRDGRLCGLSCIRLKVDCCDEYQSLSSLMVLVLKKMLVLCVHSHIQWYMESCRGQLLQMSDWVGSCFFKLRP